MQAGLNATMAAMSLISGIKMRKIIILFITGLLLMVAVGHHAPHSLNANVGQIGLPQNAVKSLNNLLP